MRAAEGTLDPERRTTTARFDVERVRRDFPILDQRVHNRPLVYLDNAATSQKPLAVIDAVSGYYLRDNANIHRGVHELSQRATRGYEEVRAKIRRFINAGSDREIVYVGGTTGAINLVAQSYGRSRVGRGDEIILTTMEHHSNIVPWQILAEEKGAHLRIAPVDDRGELILEDLEKLLGERTRIVSMVHLSNSLGTVNPVREVIRMAHARGIPVLLDGAQAAAHLRIDVQELDCDFYALSSHKMYGPTGIGILYGKEKLLEAMPPYQSGGDMISSVSFEKTHYNRLPFKFEAGTPNIAGVIGLGAAIDYLEEIGIEAAAAHENELLAYATEAVSQIPRVRIVGTAPEKAGILSFVIEGVHPHDIGTILDEQGVAIRAGHHCTQPLMERYGIPATARASFAMYNTRQDVDALLAGIRKVLEVFG
ncbi:MAG TPA: cysteine desulfurase [Candidatus Polarisedimenticolia bacterium]|jgi:cysteine desulfurase/selenocysteine lyase|nr:cysteine desulfurase [Candidatus Polarisedimenticolia bacterium]